MRTPPPRDARPGDPRDPQARRQIPRANGCSRTSSHGRQRQADAPSAGKPLAAHKVARLALAIGLPPGLRGERLAFSRASARRCWRTGRSPTTAAASNCSASSQLTRRSSSSMRASRICAEEERLGEPGVDQQWELQPIAPLVFEHRVKLRGGPSVGSSLASSAFCAVCVALTLVGLAAAPAASGAGDRRLPDLRRRQCGPNDSGTDPAAVRRQGTF